MPGLRFFSLLILLFIAGCAEQPSEEIVQPEDKFSFANYNEVVIRHVDLDLAVIFDEKALEGTATLTFEVLREGAATLMLDTRDLEIRSATVDHIPVLFSLGEPDPLLGQSLTIQIPEGATKVTVGYKTSPDASGLQWLSPEQTAGNKFPFLFSQSQAIHARSWVPLQDTPAVRFTYSANIKTPSELIALMSASQDPDGVKDGDYSFDMPQPIPSYLMAITVGDLEFRAISETIGVYGESYIVDAAAVEFADTPLMEKSNEKFFGPYRWGRYDLLVLPPSFPFGGMENPRLSFLTPTLIAGDKSLTNVVAHELAHSWSGNLVTNSTWRDSWINEGITSYVENRIMEDLYGERRAIMEQVLAEADWQRDMEAVEDSALTALALPDIPDLLNYAFSNVAYVKGQFFLHFLEDRFGREIFDPFLKNFFDHFAFKSISTADFVAYMNENLIKPNPGKVTEAEIEEWLYGPGMPGTKRQLVSNAFKVIDDIRTALVINELELEEVDTTPWTTHEWLHFINGLPGNMALVQFEALDEAFDLTNASNAEIAFAWYMKALEGGYSEISESLRGFLLRVGRGKFIYRLYQSLVESGQRDEAWEIFQEAKPGYHPIAQSRIEAIFNQTNE